MWEHRRGRAIIEKQDEVAETSHGYSQRKQSSTNFVLRGEKRASSLTRPKESSTGRYDILPSRRAESPQIAIVAGKILIGSMVTPSCGIKRSLASIPKRD